MFEYQSAPSVAEHRNIVSEIDAGELDEYYLVEHAGDYGHSKGSQRLKILKTISAGLQNLVLRLAGTKSSDKLVNPLSHLESQ